MSKETRWHADLQYLSARVDGTSCRHLCTGEKIASPMGEQVCRKQEQHIHEAVSDFISRVNPRISTGPSPYLRTSTSRDSSRCDESSTLRFLLIHAFTQKRSLGVTVTVRKSTKTMTVPARLFTGEGHFVGKTWMAGLRPTLAYFIPSLLISYLSFPCHALAGARPYSNVRLGIHGGGREPNYLLWIGDWGRLVVIEAKRK